MNNKTQKRANRSPRSKVAMPKARVMYQNVFGELSRGLHHGGGWDVPCSVRQHPTKSAAQAKVRFDNLGWEEKVKVVARALSKHYEVDEGNLWENQEGHWQIACREAATAVLHALGERPERGGGETKEPKKQRARTGDKATAFKRKHGIKTSTDPRSLGGGCSPEKQWCAAKPYKHDDEIGTVYGYGKTELSSIHNLIRNHPEHFSI